MTVIPTRIVNDPICCPPRNLGSGIVGTQTQWKDSEGQSITAVTWHEGRWQVIVEAPGSQATKAVVVGRHISTSLIFRYLAHRHGL
ncbi:MAG: hypothetical protein M1318_00885 [Firmicutes bacterium]|nr:hypothetical protein [Bacillota bacterium]